MTTITNLPIEATMPTGMLPRLIGKDAKPEDKPDADRPALTAMRAKWELGDLLLSDSEGMIEAGQDVLPREQDETEDEFRRRIARTVLTNYYGDTLDRHSGMPFAKNITFDPPLPEQLAYIERNVDGAGRSITVMARDLMREGMHRGLTHVLVDMPSGPDRDYSDTLKRRPLMVHIQPGCLYGVTDEPDAAGDDVVTYARFMQRRTVPKGQFSEESVDMVMVVRAAAVSTDDEQSVDGDVTEYSRDASGDWRIAGDPVAYQHDAVPLFTFYTKQTGAYEALPAYRYLAELNKAHWQSDADQRHALSYGRRATLVQTGWKDSNDAAQAAAKGEKLSKRQTLGYGRRLTSKDADANAFFLETGGAPLAAGREDLKALEERMERFGAAQVSKNAGITATSRMLDNQRDTCNLEAWCTRLEQVLLAAVRVMARWKGVDLPEGQKLMIDRSFADPTTDAEDLPHIMALSAQGKLSTGTVLAECRARGVLLTVTDPESELTKIADEAERLQQMQLDRMAAQIIDERENAPDATAAEDGDDEPADLAQAADTGPTLNEITLGVERLARAGNNEGANALLNEGAALLGIRSLGKVKAPVKAPAARPGEAGA